MTARLRALGLLAAVLTLLALLVAPPAGARVAGCGPSDAVGARIPLLFVHGFVSSARTWAKAVKGFCSDTVYATAFDYSEVNSNWVSDPAIGPALATEILRLANASRRGGGPGKVLLVGHSMGGLAIRCAADGRCNGGLGADPGQPSPVAEAIGAITTFDTPNLGTQLKADGRSLLSDVVGPWLSALCYGSQAARLGLDPVVNGMCDLERKFGTSDAARAFTPGSGDLDALPGQPTGVPVLAVAGHAGVSVPLFWNSVQLGAAGSGDLGDYVVSAASAQAQNYATNGFGGTADIDCGRLSVGVRLVGRVALPSVSVAGLRCWHMSETGDDDWLDRVGEMVEWFQDRPLSAADLRSAPVPALCDFPAGRLVDGRLPGQPAELGEPPTLFTSTDDGGTDDLLALGDLDGDGAGDAAAVVNCNEGGVGWPDSIVFWSGGPAGPTLLGSYDMVEAVGDARSATTGLAVADGAVVVDSLDARPFDSACCPTGRARVTLRWDGSQVVADVQHLPGPDDITFSGVGPVQLGMSDRQLEDLGYSRQDGDYYGCVFYTAGDGDPQVTYDPTTGAVVRVTPPGGSGHTSAGLGVGSLLDDVRTTYAGETVEDHLDGSFGQGTNGLLVGDGSGGWISFSTDDGFTVSFVSVSDHDHYGAVEAGCG